MELRRLGLTDIKVSLICLGTMTFGQQNSEAEGHEQMDYAVANGVNFFDTAELYAIPPSAETFGKTEEILGSWFKKTGKRKDIILATKVAGSGAPPWIRGGNTALVREQIFAACDASLKRLGTDYIDLYQTHWPDRPVNTFGKMDFDGTTVTGKEEERILETLQAMQELIKQGKIRHMGLSNETPWGVMTHLKLYAVHNLPRVVSIQNPYNLLNRTFDIGLGEMAIHEKMGLLAYSPLGGGTLTGKYVGGALPPGTRRAIDARKSRYKRPREDEAVTAYLDVARRHGLDPAQMALAFVSAQPHLTSNIIGATSMEHLKTDIASANIKLSEEALSDINAIHNKTPNPCP